MKILIIHHLEMEWNDVLVDSFNSSFDIECEKFMHYLDNNDYDRVILTMFDDYKLSDEHHYSGISDYITQVETYGYGWERESFESKDEGELWADGGVHSEVVILDDWIKELKGHDITLSGAFDGECIDDIETAMDALNIDFKREEGLIVGSGVRYDFAVKEECMSL